MGAAQFRRRHNWNKMQARPSARTGRAGVTDRWDHPRAYVDGATAGTRRDKMVSPSQFTNSMMGKKMANVSGRQDEEMRVSTERALWVLGKMATQGMMMRGRRDEQLGEGGRSGKRWVEPKNRQDDGLGGCRFNEARGMKQKFRRGVKGRWSEN